MVDGQERVVPLKEAQTGITLEWQSVMLFGYSGMICNSLRIGRSKLYNMDESKSAFDILFCLNNSALTDGASLR